jgi:hypothetical protein
MQASREVLLRLVVQHQDRKALDIFARELGSVGIGFAPGTTGIYGGRPKPTPHIRLFTLFVDKARLTPPRVLLGDQSLPVSVPTAGASTPAICAVPPVAAPGTPADDAIAVPLIRLALARSGDKADSANIAIIARDPAYVPLIRSQITPARMADHFRHLVNGPVERFEAPGIHAFNFLLHNALGGGGMASLRIDPQGKAYGQMALEMTVMVPRALADAL